MLKKLKFCKRQFYNVLTKTAKKKKTFKISNGTHELTYK